MSASRKRSRCAAPQSVAGSRRNLTDGKERTGIRSGPSGRIGTASGGCMRLDHIAAAIVLGGVLCVCPQLTWAQSLGAIAGVARDTTGAVLPGVTVEVASPALIEKIRVAVTDEQGNYKIIELPSGTYTVTFALPGFNTFKRDGIAISAGFTASV